jgi:hypothetical protein
MLPCHDRSHQRQGRANKNFSSSPESRLAMMASSPYLATSHADPCGTSPLALSSPMNCQDLVVCSLRPLLGNTDNTPGYSGTGTQAHGWHLRGGKKERQEVG